MGGARSGAAGSAPVLAVVSLAGVTAARQPVAIAQRDDGVVQAVVSGLSHHAVALGVGYAGCLLCLAIRDRFLHGRA